MLRNGILNTVPSKVEISYKTIVFTVFFLILLWFLVQAKEILAWIFVAFILMSALKPFADKLEKLHLPRVLAVLINYIVILILLAFIVSSVLPPLVNESIHLAESLPGYIRSIFPNLTFDTNIITAQITPFGRNILRVTVGVFSNIIAIFTIFVISFYLLIERKYLEPQLASFMGEEGAKDIINIISKVEFHLGAWVRGQLLLGVIIGVSTYIGLFFLLNLPFALPLAILAGVLEIVPIIGPILSAIPAILIAFAISPLMALVTFAFYFLIQQAEAHLVVPMVLRKTVGLPPLITIPALMIGAKIAGFTGALLAVPLVVTVATIVSEYLSLKSPEKK